MSPHFLLFFEHAGLWSYLILFFGMFAEATLTFLFAIFLVSQGTLNFFPVILIIFAGAVSEEVLWYWVGYSLSKSSKVSKWADRITQSITPHFSDRFIHILIASKFIYGLHRAVLARAGMLKIPFKKYMKAAVFAVILWMMIIGSLGFSFSAYYNKLKQYLKYAEFILLALVVAIFTIQYFVSKRLKKSL